MSPERRAPLQHVLDFPRVSGDEPGDDTTLPRKFAFSPRERG